MSRILIADIKKIDRQIDRCLSSVSKIPDGMEVSLNDLDLIDEHHKGSLVNLDRVSHYLTRGDINDGKIQNAIGAAEKSRSHMRSLYDITSAVDLEEVKRSFSVRDEMSSGEAATTQRAAQREVEVEGMNGKTQYQDCHEGFFDAPNNEGAEEKEEMVKEMFSSVDKPSSPPTGADKAVHTENLRDILTNMLGGLRGSLDTLRTGLERMTGYEDYNDPAASREGFGAIISFMGKFFKIIGEILTFVYKTVLFLIKMVAALTKFSVWLIGTVIKSFFKTPVSAIASGVLLYYVASAVISYLTGSGPSWIPAGGIAGFLLIFMLVNLQPMLKSIQDTIIDLTMYLFTNPLSRYILGIRKDTKFITEKNKAKAIAHFVTFLVSNLFRVLLFLVLLAILFKFAVIDIASAVLTAFKKKFLG
jgi:hypothetical protein